MHRTDRLLTLGSALVLLVSTANAQSAAPAPGREQTLVRDLDPFAHLARIPTGADLSSIRFQGVKVVKIPTSSKSTTNAHYCEELAFRDPGGSWYCPHVQFEAPTPAYEVTYSYQGQPLASDEYGNKYFTFSVYFRPEEFGSATRETLSRGKAARSDIAALFNPIISRDAERRAVIDEATSTFCEGTYIDGLWNQTNPQCKDNVKSKTVETLPEYVTVRVDPVSSIVAASATPSTAGVAAKAFRVVDHP